MKRPELDSARTRRYEQAAGWALRDPDDPATAAAFRAWLDADIENANAYGEMRATLEEAESVASAPDMVRMRGEALLLARRSHEVQGAKAFFRSRLGVAAALVLLVVALVATAIGLRMQSHRFATDVGERRAFTLNDGSTLSLDAASHIYVDYSRDRRSLTLERGRARFDVKKDALRPFTVAAAGQVVVATGTSFSVELVNDQLHVVLFEGRVEVLPSGTSPQTSLRAADPGEPTKHWVLQQPGSELVVSDVAHLESGRVAAVDTTRAASWQSGKVTFADEPLALAVARINRYSTHRVSVADPAAASVRISGVFDAGDTAAFIDGVTLLFPVRAQPEGAAATALYYRQQN